MSAESTPASPAFRGRKRGLRGVRPLTVIAAVVTVALLALSGATGRAPAPGSPSLRTSDAAPPVSGTTPTEVIGDGGSISVSAPRASVLTDTVTDQSGGDGNRSYQITLRASVSIPGVAVEVETNPIAQWALPNQLPGGADNLPPLAMWSWTVLVDGAPPAAPWNSTTATPALSGTTTWTNQTIAVIGTTNPTVTVQVDPDVTDGTTTPGTGFVLNTPGVVAGIPSNESGLEAAAAALHPQVVRFSTVLAGTALPWNTRSDQPQYNFTGFDRDAAFAASTGAQIVLSLPVGTWGDGNLLPAGMPLNTSVQIFASTGTGYFPQAAAWVALVEGIVNHTLATYENIEYWSIGNEFPNGNQTLVEGYTQLFDLAATAIHSRLPDARVGSDAMMNTTYEAYFATHATGVGFLSFHYYPGLGICVANGTYCAPMSPANGITDPSLFSHASYAFLGGYNSPATAQELWFNTTGTWLPVLNTETNLNPSGGNSPTSGTGTDPRIQTLFGASWVSVVLIDGAFQNVSALTYFALSSGWGRPATVTEPYGGWGFGLTSETASDATESYAPYLALELWGDSMPYGSPGLVANSSAPSVIEPYATFDGTNLSVFVVNRVNVPVTVDPSVTVAGYRLACVSTLDQRSYQEIYVPSLGQTVLDSASVDTSPPASGGSFTLDGYGVATLRYVPDAAASSPCAPRALSAGPDALGATVLLASGTFVVSGYFVMTWWVLPTWPTFPDRLRRVVAVRIPDALGRLRPRNR
ncbi:MAG: hypothetical protein WBF81_00330 [Thermoplasmata archaeon]